MNEETYDFKFWIQNTETIYFYDTFNPNDIFCKHLYSCYRNLWTSTELKLS